MPQQVKAFGQILQFPDGMTDDQMAEAIRSNEHVLNPDYKPPLTDKLNALAKEHLGVDSTDVTRAFTPTPSIADQAEASANEGENAAAPQVPGAPVRQSAYNKALLNPQDTIGGTGVKSRIGAAANEDIKGQTNQQELELLRTEALKPSESGFTASALNSTGRTIKGVGQVSSDFLGADKDNAITQYGQKLLDNNPLWVNKLGKIEDEPFLAFKEATGNSVPSMAAMVGIKSLGIGIASLAPLTGPAAPVVAAVGSVVQWLGPAAVAALPSYSSIRDSQILKDPKNEADAKSKAIAALGASVVGAIEVAFGPQQWVLAMLTKEGRAAMARKFASTSVGEAAIKGGLIGGVTELGEEIIQSPIEQLSSYEDPTTKKNLLETAHSGAMGFLGGTFPGAVTGAASQVAQQAKVDRLKPIADAPTVDDAIVAAHEAVKPKEDILRTVDPTLADIEALTGAKPNETQTATNNTGQTQASEILDIVLPDNSSVKAQWKVVDADQLAASMKEDVNQPRDRTRAASDVQIKSIANAPDYRRLSDSPVMDVGAPVVDQDGRIVAGNGRFAGLSQAYEQGTATEYLNQLRADAARKGLSIEGIAKPVLVRQLAEPVDTRKLAIASNSGTTLQMSALEQAKLDAERMKGVENLDVNDLGDIALTPRNLTQLKDSLGTYTSTELGSLVDKGGQLSQEGVRRVRNAMLAKAYGSSPVLEKLVESTDSDMRNVLGALTKSANHIISTKGDTKALLEAVDTYAQLKATGQPVDNFLAQQDAFSDGLSKEAEDILRFIDTNVRSQKKLTDFIKGNFREVDTTSADMFESKPPNSYIDESKRHPNAKAASKNSAWVIKNKSTGEILFETFDKAKVDALNTSKYEAVPIYEHLTGLNKDERITSLEKHLKDNGYDFTVEPASVRDTDALDSTRKARKELAEKQAKLFKKKVVFVKADGPFSINGVMVPNIADTIFVDIRTAKPFDAIMAHELSHWMEQEKPEVYKAMIKSLKTVIINEAEYAKKYGIEGASKAELTKEIAGDIMGDNFTQQSFWDKVAAANPEAFKDIAAAIIKWLKGVIVKAKANGMGSEEWVKDAVKAQDIVAKAVAQYTGESKVEGAEGGVKFHKAFHGSPHDHNKFDTSKIGTGEGAQAYGFGHYFTDTKDVADYYKGALENSSLEIDGKVIPNISGGHRNVDVIEKLLIDTYNLDDQTASHIALAFNKASSKSDVIKWMNNRIEMYRTDNSPEAVKQMSDVKSKFESLPIKIEAKNTGKLYEVELAPEQDEYLLWDEPLSKQSDKVKAALGEIDFPITFKDSYKAIRDVGSDPFNPKTINIGNGNEFYSELAKKVGGSKKASEYLHSLGIRGIKYLDGLSRGKGEGAYNYVIFDDKDVSITAKFSRASKQAGFDFGKINLDYGNIEQRPETTEKQRNVGINAYQALLERVANRAGARVLGLAMAKDFKEQNGSSLIGKEVITPDDLATVAQVLRDPRFETFRVFYVKDGKIVHHTGLTSRLPGVVNVISKAKGESQEDATDRFFTTIRQQKIDSGAHGYYLLHNHPSGRAVPSAADELITKAIADQVPGFISHIVIDTNEYATISRNGQSNLVQKELRGGYGTEVMIPHDALQGRVINGPVSMAEVGKLLQRPEGFFTLLGLSAQNKVISISEVPLSVLSKGGVRLVGMMRRFARNGGAYRLSVVTDADNMMNFRKAVESGVLLDVVDTNGNSLREKPGISWPSGGLFNDNKPAIRVAQDDSKGKPLPESFFDWFGNSKVVDDQGRPLVVYHGTTADFTEFDQSKANAESDLGAGFYFTNTEDDVSENYAGMGPDLTNKVERLAEQIASETDREYDDPDVIKEAKARFVQHEGATLPVYLRLENPVVIGGDNETEFTYEENYNEELDEYEEPTGTLVDLLDSMSSVEADFSDVDMDAIRSALFDNGEESISASDLIARIKEASPYVMDNDTGDMVVSEFIRRSFEYSGFDGIIDNTVDEKFGSQKKVGKAMVGMEYDTVHYIAFQPNQIKSAVGNNGQFSKTNDDIRFSRAPKLYSKLEQALEAASDKVFSTGPQVKLWLQSNAGKMGIKKDEIYWSGIDNWLDAQGKVSKQQVVEFVRNNGVKVEDVTLGGDQEFNAVRDKLDRMLLDELEDRPVDKDEQAALEKRLREIKNTEPKHNNDKLTLPGGTDYKELVVTVPTIEPHNADDTTHFGDTGQGKQIGWLRMDTRDGGLFIEELQSQRAQQGRSKGFVGKPLTLGDIVVKKEPVTYKFDPRDEPGWSWAAYDNEGNRITSFPHSYSEERAKRSALSYINSDPNAMKAGVPPAPFVSDANNKATNAYITLLMKKALIEAVSNDHASVSWTTGDQQADRYDLSKQVDTIAYLFNKDRSTVTIQATKDNSFVYGKNNLPVSELADNFGKDIAKKISNDEGETNYKTGYKELSGLDLKTGGEWAQSMYGNEQGLNLQGKPSLMSQAANDIFKHVGSGKVESINGQPGFYVTPEMKSKDLPLFSRAKTITVDGIERPTENSEGKPINNPVNFWKWFGDDPNVDDQGRPKVLYHSTLEDVSEFNPVGKFMGYSGTSGISLTDNKEMASRYLDRFGERRYDGVLFQKNVMPVYAKIGKFIERNEPFRSEVRFGAPLPDNYVHAHVKLGYDTVIRDDAINRKGVTVKHSDAKNALRGKEYIVSNPNQIKSAIGNNGGYSLTNNDIRFSKAPTPPEETRLRRFQRMNQDSFNRFTVIKEWLAENGQTLSDKADVYGAEERYHSMAANQLEDFREQQRNPLIEKIQKAGYTLGDIEVFLKMQHAQEANAQIRKLGDNPDATAYGIEDQEAADYLAEAPEDLAKLANEFRDITEQTKKLRLDAGILNTDITDAWEGAYKHYVPVKGEADSTRGVGKGLKTNFKSKRRLGHSLRDEHVIENILMDHERAIMEVERNRVGKHLVMMAAEMQRPDILSIDQPEKRKVLKTDTAYTVEANGVVQGVFKSRDEAKIFKQLYATSMPKVAPSAITINQTKDQRVIASASPILAENEVNVYMNGHAIRVQINDELLARAYTKMGVEQFSDIVAAGRILNGYLSKVYTGYNPEFILTNMIRDFSSGTINLTGEQGIGMAIKALTNYPRMFTDLLKYAATNGKSSTKWIDAYRKNGGNTGAAYLSDMERLGNEVSTEYASYQGVLSNLKQGDTANAARAAGRKVFNATLKWIYNLNQAGENAMRLAAFKAMIDSGRTVNEAAKVAKNITVNFNRKGERQWAPALYLFYNASVQGTAATMHALTKGKHKGQAWALAGSMVAVGYMMAASFGGGSEDDWDEINDYTKERNLLIKSGDGYLKIPIPYGYGFFYNLGRFIADAQRTGEWGKMPWHLATSAISEFTPFNDVVVGSDEEFRSDQVFMGFLPTAMKIIAQPVFNKQLFSGSELMPESQFDKSQPDRQKMFRGTKGTMYDEVAGWLDAAGMDVSPETLKYITRTGTGGAGSLVDTTISAAMLKSEGAELDTQEIPFVRKGYMALGIKDKRAAYYKVREEARTAAEEFNRARRDNDVAKMQTVLKDKKELIALDRYANKLAATIDAARDQQDAVRADKNLSVQEKRLKLKDMEATEAKFYDQYLDVFKAQVRR